MDKKKNAIVNRDLLLPYGLPYLAYVGIATISSGRLSHELNYILKIIIVPALLFWAWKWFGPIRGPKSISGSVILGVVFGVIGLIVWCLLMAPFIDLEGESWSGTAFLLRLLAASLIVPVFEELIMRGYFLKTAYQFGMNLKKMGPREALECTLERDNIDDVEPGAWSVTAITLSTLAFTVGHLTVEWPAAIVYGILMSVLWIIRKDLLSCMVAHGVTNFGLALYVYYTGHWGFW